MVEVKRLISPEMLVEVEAVAIVAPAAAKPRARKAQRKKRR
jgi:hypothetical protein